MVCCSRLVKLAIVQTASKQENKWVLTIHICIFMGVNRLWINNWLSLFTNNERIDWKLMCRTRSTRSTHNFTLYTQCYITAGRQIIQWLTRLNADGHCQVEYRYVNYSMHDRIAIQTCGKTLLKRWLRYVGKGQRTVTDTISKSRGLPYRVSW